MPTRYKAVVYGQYLAGGAKPPLDPHPAPSNPAPAPVDREPLDHGDPAPGPEAAFDPATGVNNSAERVADLEFALERQNAITTALHQQIIETDSPEPHLDSRWSDAVAL